MLDQSKLAVVFGIEMADAIVPELRAKAAPAKNKIPVKEKTHVKRKNPARKKKVLKHKAATGMPKRMATAPRRKRNSE